MPRIVNTKIAIGVVPKCLSTKIPAIKAVNIGKAIITPYLIANPYPVAR